MLALFADWHPNVELTVICGTSPVLLEAVERRKLDLAIVTEQAQTEGRTAICESELAWVAGSQLHVNEKTPLPLAFMPIGWEYRRRALAALDKVGRTWRMTVNSLSPTGVRAAIRADLAISAMPLATVEKGYRVLSETDGFPKLESVRISAYSRPEIANALTRGFVQLAIGSLSASTRQRRR